MPVAKTKRTVIDISKLDLDWSDLLIDGCDFVLPKPDEQLIEKMWLKHKDSIMELWFQFKPFELNGYIYKCHPGSRPRGWWMFEAPEPRKQIAGIPGVSHLHNFGLPLGYSYKIPDVADFPRFETQKAYLERLGLLTQDETDFFASGGQYIPIQESPEELSLPYPWQQEQLRKYKVEHGIC